MSFKDDKTLYEVRKNAILELYIVLVYLGIVEEYAVHYHEMITYTRKTMNE